MLNETYRAMLGHKSVIRETFMYGKQRAAEIGYENVFDYSLGNPSVPCPDKFTKAMQTLLAEEEPVALHGYCPSQGDPGFRTAVAAHLAKTFGLPYEQKDIFPTTGAAGAIAHAVRAVTKPGDEVLTFAPYFPEYGPYVEGTGAVLKVVPPQAPAFQPNLDAFEEMLTENVTCVLINTPNNPTGVVYSAETLSRLADILTEKSKAFGHNIFLVSDEPYRDIAFDGKKVPYPAALYPHTLTCFSFSKSLSLPGERLGYVAVRPGCEGEDVLVDMMAQISRFTGHNCPPSIIQKATAECLDVTSDLSVYETNMDLLYDKLTELGFEVERPGGTFYIFPKAPGAGEKKKNPRRTGGGFCMLQGALPGPYFPGFHVPLNSGARFLCSRFLCSRFLPFPDSFVPAFLCFSLLVFPGWRGGHFGYSLPPAPGTGFPPPASVAGMPGRSSSPADSSVRAECCFLVCRRAVLRSRSPTRMMLSLPVQSRL